MSNKKSVSQETTGCPDNRPSNVRRKASTSDKTDDVRLRLREASSLFHYAADTTRLTVLHMLAEGPCGVGSFCRESGLSRQVIDHHLAILRLSGLIEQLRCGTAVEYRLLPRGRALVKATRAVLAS